MKHRLEKRPDAVLDVFHHDGCSALYFAATHGSLDMIKVLLAAGVDPFFENYDGFPATFELFRRILLERGSPQERDALMELIPMSAFLDDYSFSHIERVVLGLRPLSLQDELDKAVYKNELNAQNGMGMAPLHWATMKKDASTVSTLLHAGAYVDTPDQMGKTALYHACNSNWENGAKNLIAFGANVDIQTHTGYRPIIGAAAGNATRGLLSLLVSAGADIDESRNHYRATPLIFAAVFNSSSSCSHLLDLGANIEQQDHDGHTPLFASVTRNAHACTQLFFLKGANYLHKDNEQRTLFHMAAMHGDRKTLEILIKAALSGLQVNAKDSRLMTAQQCFAARKGVPPEAVERFEALVGKLNRENVDVAYEFEADSSDDNDFFDASETAEG
ncbi:MAG: hypothetical protein M1821_004540 [Bathelium mastoideum]|nr:MAG: hypothetical protein M1821_004540 [Bathelium mastoideum]